MFQLNSNSGKFDIVFTNDPTIDSNVKGKQNNMSNATIRARKEYRSTVLQTNNNKQNQDTNANQDTKKNSKANNGSRRVRIQTNNAPVIRGNRAAQLRGGTKDGASPKKEKPPIKNDVSLKLTPQPKPKNKTNTSNIPRLNNNQKNDKVVRKTQTKVVEGVASQKKNSNEKLNEKQINNNDDLVDNASELPNRPRTYVFKKENKARLLSDVHEDAGILTKGQLDNIFRDFYQDDEVAKVDDSVNHDNDNKLATYDTKNMVLNDDSSVIEPTVVPGLDLSQEMPAKSKSNAKPVPVPNRLHQSLESSRQDEIRKKQSTPSEEYNPWGRPGAGAPMKTGTGNIRSALKRYKDVKVSESLTQSVQYSVVEEKNDTRLLDISPFSSPRTKNESTSFARGKPKTDQDFQDNDLKRKKHLEHQEAIKAQVEEKRKLRKLEKEKQLHEEKLAEERYFKQQEVLKQRMEEEARLQREKEELKRAKEEALGENLRKAAEAAAIAKSKQIQNKKVKEGNSKKNTKSENISSKEPIQYDDRPIETQAPSKKLMGTYTINKETFEDDEEMLSKFTQGSPSSTSPINLHYENSTSSKEKKVVKKPKKKTKKNENSLSQRNPKSEETFEDDYLKSSSIGRENPNKSSPREKPKNFNRGNPYEEHQYISDENLAHHRTNSYDNNTNDEDNSYYTQNDIRLAKLPMRNDSYRSNSGQKKPKDEWYHSDASVITEYLPSPTSSPTSRQQQILEQLNNLRQGLMRKQLEYLEH